MSKLNCNRLPLNPFSSMALFSQLNLRITFPASRHFVTRHRTAQTETILKKLIPNPLCLSKTKTSPMGVIAPSTHRLVPLVKFDTLCKRALIVYAVFCLFQVLFFCLLSLAGGKNFYIEKGRRAIKLSEKISVRY